TTQLQHTWPVSRRDAVFRCALALADVLAAAAAIALATGAPPRLLALPLVLIAGKLTGTYSREELVLNKTTLDQAPQLFQLATLSTLAGVVVAGGELSIVPLWGAPFALPLLARRAARGVAHALTPVERLLFVGSEPACDRLRAKLSPRALIAGRM